MSLIDECGEIMFNQGKKDAIKKLNGEKVVSIDDFDIEDVLERTVVNMLIYFDVEIVSKCCPMSVEELIELKKKYEL